MSRFQQKPEGISAKGKSRIYITGHPKDVDDHFESISDEILKIRNVVFYRESEMDESETSDEDFRTLRENQFQEMNLIVFLVSRRFLSSECRSRLVEYDVAMEMKIPILPIVLDKYAAKDFGPVMNEMKKGYGNIQFVDRSSLYTDYIEKLKGSITSILLGEELTDQIRSAFDAQVFLSYRKKDITPCRELMRMIHRIPLCERIAIWYDNFLVGGEDWTDAIADAMESSQAVILAITEHITEKNEEGDDNYIVSTEYPMAQKRNKPILPIELFHFDESDLQRLFSDFPPVPIIDGRDEAAVKEAFKSYLTDVALTVNSKPEHNYWLGLAYLEGIGSERDPQHAISLLSKAVECDHLADAAERLSKIYWYGNGVSIDYDVSMEWKRKEIRILEEAYQSAENSRDLDAAERGEALYLSATNYADRYAAIEEYDRARKIYADIIPLARELFGKFGEKYCRGESFLYRKMADSYGEEQNYREAREKYLESLNFNRKVKETVHTANVTKGIFEDCIKLLYNACCLMDFEDARNWERLARQALSEKLKYTCKVKVDTAD